jgi:hypothetical protein
MARVDAWSAHPLRTSSADGPDPARPSARDRRKDRTGPGSAPRADRANPSTPDSALARAAEDACRRLPTAIVGHSYRTWAYGRALAALDGDIGLDDELFYVAALLHDAGLIEAVTGEDFTLRSGHVAAACVAPHHGDDALRVRDAISAHATPGATVAADGAEAYYVQVGATVDLAGLCLQRLSADFVADHPRQGLTAAITPLIRAEAEANPWGRFALLDRWGFALAIRLAPFPEK